MVPYFQALCFSFGHLQGHRWRSFRFVCENVVGTWNFSRTSSSPKPSMRQFGLYPWWTVLLGGRTAVFTTCFAPVWVGGSVKRWLNDPTSSKWSNAVGIFVDHCVQNLRWLLLIIRPRKLRHQKIRTLLLVDPRFIDFSCHNREVFVVLNGFVIRSSRWDVFVLRTCVYQWCDGMNNGMFHHISKSGRSIKSSNRSAFPGAHPTPLGPHTFFFNHNQSTS